MQGRTLLCALAVSFAFTGLACAPRDPRPPNIILLIGDDHGYPDYGFTGSKWVRTPNLDRLAAGGTLFTRAHTTSSLCLDSLLSLLTGLYPYQWHHQVCEMRNETGCRQRESRVLGDESHWTEHRVGDRFAIEHFATLPRLLADRGYVSFEGGKYWEGDFRTAGFSDGMTRAFDSASPSGGAGLSLGRQSMQAVYSFIDENRSVPFFVWFAPMLPHPPHNAPLRFEKLYSDSPISERAAHYYASCTWYDSLVGDLIRHLDERGLRNETLLVYLSDNGWDQRPEDDRRERDVLNMGGRVGKGSLHDMGFRTPIIINWPGHVAAGQVLDPLVSAVDILPTLLEYAGVSPPAELAGHSLVPWVDGIGGYSRASIVGSMHHLRPPAGSPRENTGPYVDPDQGYYVRTEKWHFIWYTDRGHTALYDAELDPYAVRDVAGDHPALIARFKDEVENWRAEMARGPAATREPTGASAPPSSRVRPTAGG